MKKIVVLILLGISLVSLASAQVAVIANKDVPVDTIEKQKLLDLFTGDIRRWDNDEPAIVFDLKEKSIVKERFYDFLGKSTTRMKSIWLKKMLSGEGDPPEALTTEKEMVKKVAETSGAIGFVSQSSVTDSVKTLLLIPAEKK